MNGNIVLKGLPANCSDLDIRHALGDVVEIQMNYTQQTAVVRLRYPATAQAFLQQGRVHINNVVVSVEQQQQQQAPPPPQQQQSQASAAPYSSSYASSSAPSYYHQHQSHHHHQMQHQTMMQQQASSNSLQVVVDGCTYPITQDVLTQVFSRIARPIDIACGPTGTTTVARVTLPDAASAMRAIAELNNKCIYPNCCTMKVSMDAAPSYSLMPPVSAAPSYQSYASQGYDMQHQHMATGGGRGGFDSAVPYGSMRGGRGRGRGMMMGSMDAPGFAQGGRGGFNQQQQQLPYGFQSNSHHHHQHHQHQQHMQQHQQHHHQHHGVGSQQFGDAPVVIVTGVPESVPLHNLWVLLEVYGNVKWLKRQHTNAQNVVAQFQNLHDARSVLVHLQGCPFYGSTLQFKHFAGYVERTSSRTEWNSGPATDPATTAFLFDSCHHRTKPSAPYNPKQKSRPEPNLFVANLSDDITDEDVHNTFAAHGFPLVALYRKSPVTAIVQCESVPKAVEALIAVHAAKLNERFISVAFSRYPPGPPPANSAQHSNADNTGGGGGETEVGGVAPVGGGNEESSFAAAEQAPLPAE